MLNRYAEAIEADFAHIYPNTDPIQLWQERRWRKLLNLIDRLPLNSCFMDEMANDEELAKSQPEPDGDGKPPPPRLRDWSPEVNAIALLADRVITLIQATIAAQGGKPPTLPYMDRPVTAAERIARKREQEKLMKNHEKFKSRLLRNNPE